MTCFSILDGRKKKDSPLFRVVVVIFGSMWYVLHIPVVSGIFA